MNLANNWNDYQILDMANGEKLENEVDFQTGYRKVVTYKD